ncbi:MAG: hypothetical protein LBM99_06310 [Bacillales bacterium]|jgi:1-acyl-sn-glycerol-3-phosphate acyltransferase|nr:hypothetical protein [Bacillales bacterium]
MKKWKPQTKPLKILDAHIPTEDKVERLDFNKHVAPPGKFIKWLERFLAKLLTKPYQKQITLEVDNIDNNKQYLFIGTHMSFLDMPSVVNAMPYKEIIYISAIDAANDYTNWLLSKVGIIFKRKFVKDLVLLKNMKYSITKYKTSSLMLYPEARYSLDGCRSYIPNSMGKLAKFLKLPVVVCKLEGNYITSPQWRGKKVVCPIKTSVKEIINEDELNSLTEDEISDKILKQMDRDDFKYQKENNIIIDDPDRAYGLGSLLYKCPHCKTEFMMEGVGTKLICHHCQKEWEMNELGELVALNGETEYKHIPEWFNWQKKEVSQEISLGNYHFEDKVVIHTLPTGRKISKLLKNGFIHHGYGHISQDNKGTWKLTGHIYNKDQEIIWEPLYLDGLHIEYKYMHTQDCLDISTIEESYWCYPTTAKNVVTKLSLATDEFHRLANLDVK